LEAFDRLIVVLCAVTGRDAPYQFRPSATRSSGLTVIVP
jgi:hypothetical protein